MCKASIFITYNFGLLWMIYGHRQLYGMKYILEAAYMSF